MDNNSQAFTLTTEPFDYQAPALIVGKVVSDTSAIVTIETIDGEVVSEKPVTANPNEIFITEVRANKINQNLKTRKNLKAQTFSGEVEEIPDENLIVVVHAASTKDLCILHTLKNDPESNRLISENPIEISDATTLTCKLGKEEDDIASNIAKEKA